MNTPAPLWPPLLAALLVGVLVALWSMQAPEGSEALIIALVGLAALGYSGYALLRYRSSAFPRLRKLWWEIVKGVF